MYIHSIRTVIACGGEKPMPRSDVKGEEKIDICHFISNLPLGIEQFSKAVRKHWGIETTCHWSLDVTYGEDGLRTRQRTVAENLAWLRRGTLSLLKQHHGKDNLSMKYRPAAGMITS